MMNFDIIFGKSSLGNVLLNFLFTTHIQVNLSPILWHVTTSDPPYSETDVTTTENRASETMSNKKLDTKQSSYIIIIM